MPGKRVDDSAWIEDVRIEEIRGEADLCTGRVARQHVQAIAALPLDPTAQQTVAEPECDGGKLSGDRRIDIRLITRVLTERLWPSKSGRYWL